MVLKIITIYIFFTQIFPHTFETSWGKCTLLNHGSSFKDSDLITLIYDEIYQLETAYGTISHDDFSISIVNDNKQKIFSNHWKWSLGITYNNPDRIIIKDPSYVNKHKDIINPLIVLSI